MSAARQYSMFPAAARAEVARLVREADLPPYISAPEPQAQTRKPKLSPAARALHVRLLRHARNGIVDGETGETLFSGYLAASSNVEVAELRAAGLLKLSADNWDRPVCAVKPPPEEPVEGARQWRSF